MQRGVLTRVFRQTGAKKDVLTRYVEIDFPEVTTKKAMAIRKSKELSAHLGKPEEVALGKCGHPYALLVCTAAHISCPTHLTTSSYSQWRGNTSLSDIQSPCVGLAETSRGVPRAPSNYWTRALAFSNCPNSPHI